MMKHKDGLVALIPMVTTYPRYVASSPPLPRPGKVKVDGLGSKELSEAAECDNVLVDLHISGFVA